MLKDVFPHCFRFKEILNFASYQQRYKCQHLLSFEAVCLFTTIPRRHMLESSELTSWEQEYANEWMKTWASNSGFKTAMRFSLYGHMSWENSSGTFQRIKPTSGLNGNVRLLLTTHVTLEGVLCKHLPSTSKPQCSKNFQDLNLTGKWLHFQSLCFSFRVCGRLALAKTISFRRSA